VENFFPFHLPVVKTSKGGDEWVNRLPQSQLLQSEKAKINLFRGVFFQWVGRLKAARRCMICHRYGLRMIQCTEGLSLFVQAGL
jgi:hypothetical protein